MRLARLYTITPEHAGYDKIADIEHSTRKLTPLRVAPAATRQLGIRKP